MPGGLFVGAVFAVFGGVVLALNIRGRPAVGISLIFALSKVLSPLVLCGFGFFVVVWTLFHR